MTYARSRLGRETPDPTLVLWRDIDWDEEPTGLLLGNGASRAVWDRFNYPSLFTMACSDHIAHPLNSVDQKLFSSMRTPNFEAVLATLSAAMTVGIAMEFPISEVAASYRRVQRALFEAVRYVHVIWERIGEMRLAYIQAELSNYRQVFTTNYDLILYWAMMAQDLKYRPQEFRFLDFFWKGREYFDEIDTSIVQPDRCTTVYFLHGALHLRTNNEGRTRKIRSDSVSNLLEKSLRYQSWWERPLFITEGTADQKRSSIRRSSYLSFAYERLVQHEGPLVVFGHSLGEADAHIVEAMRSWGSRPIAISVRRTSDDEIVGQKAWYRRSLPAAELVFFDAASHPLGSPYVAAPDTLMPAADATPS